MSDTEHSALVPAAPAPETIGIAPAETVESIDLPPTDVAATNAADVAPAPLAERAAEGAAQQQRILSVGGPGSVGFRDADLRLPHERLTDAARADEPLVAPTSHSEA